MTVLVMGPDSRTQHILNFLRRRKYHVLTTVVPVTVSFLRDNGVEYLISYGYAPILKPPVTTEYSGRIINIHPAYLPQGRGIYTNMWSFVEGRPKGVSIHFIDDGIDTGDIIARQELQCEPGDTLRSTHAKLDRAVEALFYTVWDDIVSGDCNRIVQDELPVTARGRNRIQSEKVMDLLPELWDTTTEDAEKLGADLFISASFWERYDADVMESAEQGCG